VNNPAQEEHPKHASQDKLDQSHQNPTLHELPQAGNEEAADGGDDVLG
jgi:hypothetical protein